MSLTIQQIKENNLLLFEGIVGSTAYGIATKDSDVDIKGVYIQNLTDILGFNYVEQVNDDKHDKTYYEIKRFLQLLQSNNPNILELISLPEEFVLYKSPLFDLVLKHKDKFISKTCRNSFGGYAIEQIKKARGLNKKIVNPLPKERKEVLDFCYVPVLQGSLPIKDYLQLKNLKQANCGLSAVPHMRYVYGVYHHYGHTQYKGIVQDEKFSNDISLSSIEDKDEMPICYIYFNKDGYSTYCKEYREYWEWQEKKNEKRYNDNLKHGKGYDGKNMAHCHRLLDMAIEIAKGEGINVKRSNKEELLLIRTGEYDYDRLVEEAEKKIVLMDELYEKSNLPDKVDKEFVNDLLIEIRQKHYSKGLLPDC